MLHALKPSFAKPSKAASVLVVGLLAASFGVVDAAAVMTPAGAAQTATAADFSRLRTCESGGNYHTSTGNGYFGAYQFDLHTWHALGYSGSPAGAAPSVQDAAARRLQASRGWQPWSSCAGKLGLGATHATRVPVRASRTRRVIPGRHAAVPAFSGHVLSTAIVRTANRDVRRWQQKMHQRGWHITVDGHFGRQSAAMASRFAAEKHLRTRRGTVDRTLWIATWRLPVR